MRTLHIAKQHISTSKVYEMAVVPNDLDVVIERLTPGADEGLETGFRL